MATYFKAVNGRVTDTFPDVGEPADERLLSDTDDVEPGWWVHSTGQNVRDYPPLTDTLRLQQAAREVHDFFTREVRGVRDLVGDFPTASIQAVEDVEYRFHQGMSAVLEGRMNADITLTLAQKMTFCEQMLLGASDISNAEALVAAYPTLKATAEAAGREVPPSHPVVYVDPRTGTRVTAAQAVILSGPRSAGVAAAALELQEPPTSTHLARGGWIERLRA